MNEPKDFRAIQQKYCDSKDRSDESDLHVGARLRVRRTIQWANNVGLDVGKVLCVGPRYGAEMHQFRDHTDTIVSGLEPVADFAAFCREDGLAIVESTVEDAVLTPGWNIFASHSIEHCYDRTLAIDKLKANCDEWFYIETPIEPNVIKDEAHFSPFRSHDELFAHFAGWNPIASDFGKPSEHGTINAAILFHKPQG